MLVAHKGPFKASADTQRGSGERGAGKGRQCVSARAEIGGSRAGMCFQPRICCKFLVFSVIS